VGRGSKWDSLEKYRLAPIPSHDGSLTRKRRFLDTSLAVLPEAWTPAWNLRGLSVVRSRGVARSVLVSVLAVCTACTRGVSHTGDGRDASSHLGASTDQHGAENASAWWRWAAQRLRVLSAEAGVDTDSEAARLGPSAAEIRPFAEPDDPVPLPQRVDADELRDACRVLWLTRQVLPPDSAEERFAARLRALQEVLRIVPKVSVTWSGPDILGHSDLGFGIRRRSMEVGTSIGTRAGVGCSFDLASRGERLIAVRIECSATREIAPAVRAALGPAFQPIPACARCSSFWRVHYRWPDAWAAARDARSAVLGDAPDAPLPAELVTAYERLTSPFDERLVVWKRSEGRGYEETEALLGAKRYDLLRQVLRGPNPEGRAYAALALHDARALDASDRRTVEALRLASPAIGVVEIPGDVFSTERAERFFSELRWPQRADIAPDHR
jgi:hypothetical protein